MPNFVLDSAKVSNRPLYVSGTSIKSQETKRHAKLCIRFCKSIKPPIVCFRWAYSSDRKQVQKKLNCRVWFHFTKEYSISFEDVWPERMIFDSLVEKAGAIAL